MTDCETLNPYNLETLKPQIKRFGYQFYYLPEIPSTMILAEDYIRAGNEQAAVFLTDHQTQGRGREDRVWLDKPGGSILVTAVLGIKDSTISTFADLVALHTALILRSVPLIDNVCIKYPNDLVIGDKKVGGILAVNNYDDGLQYLGTSVGIGVNVHYSADELAGYPTDYEATALDLHTPKKINSRQLILAALLEPLRFLVVDAETFSNAEQQQRLNNMWRDISSVLGRKVRVRADGESLVEGRVVDTQIGEGILVEGSLRTEWFNQFNTKMKVRLLD